MSVIIIIYFHVVSVKCRQSCFSIVLGLTDLSFFRLYSKYKCSDTGYVSWDVTRASNEHFSECFNTSPTFSVKDKNTLLLVKSLQYSIECIPNSDSTTPESTDCRCHNTSQRFGKNCMAYLSWLVLTSLSFYELVWENLWFSLDCCHTLLLSSSTGVTNWLFLVNEVKWFLLTFSWWPEHWNRNHSLLSAVSGVLI